MDKKYLIYSTVQLRNDEGEGTGVIVNLANGFENDVPVIITNKHVIEKCPDIELTLTVQTKEGNYATQECKLVGAREKCIFLDEYDLCAIPLRPLFMGLSGMERLVVASFVCLGEFATAKDFAESDPISDLYVVGYPDGFRDRKNNLPIAKKGVSSTPLFSDYEGRKEFLVDCGLCQGSSGSPVFIKGKTNNYKLAGIVYATKNISVEGSVKDANGNVNRALFWVPSGIGIAIKAQEILNLRKKLIRLSKFE